MGAHTRAWGYGYATEAAQAVKSWCHDERRIERLVSLIAPDNVRSQRVAESSARASKSGSRRRSAPPTCGHISAEASARQDG